MGREARSVPPPLLTRLVNRGNRSARNALWSGRRAHAARRLAELPPKARIHLGSGSNYLDGWCNIDIERAVRPDVVHDLRLGLPLPEGSARLIYSEHVLEHFDLSDGMRLLRDCRTGLAGGGRVRVAMPDLSSVVDAYRGNWQDQAWLADGSFPDVDTPARMLNYSLREWGHRYLYDADELRLRLQQAGYVDISFEAWGESTVEDLRGLETRPESVLIAEGIAP